MEGGTVGRQFEYAFKYVSKNRVSLLKGQICLYGNDFVLIDMLNGPEVVRCIARSAGALSFLRAQLPHR